MAVPKKKTSRSKRDIRRKSWERKITKQVLIALSMGKVFESKKSKSFIFPSSFNL
uniref:Large ribosomal subunit protein bL32c n=1 Tax=Lepocinclis playfairiana TaxID=1403386 RepID=A0A3G3LLJ7_9EUGL|nr:ribosomal protein L32 [Lepocinclis playfairiana]AYQ93580.1 ribosomal protein L32 [Lepocinclis playfairiana]